MDAESREEFQVDNAVYDPTVNLEDYKHVCYCKWLGLPETQQQVQPRMQWVTNKIIK
jgi:hypothetical protein